MAEVTKEWIGTQSNVDKLDVSKVCACYMSETFTTSNWLTRHLCTAM